MQKKKKGYIAIISGHITWASKEQTGVNENGKHSKSNTLKWKRGLQFDERVPYLNKSHFSIAMQKIWQPVSAWR